MIVGSVKHKTPTVKEKIVQLNYFKIKIENS